MPGNDSLGDGPFATPDFGDRLRRRERAAWAALYGAYGVRLRLLAYRILPPRLDPEGVAQQVWVQALHKAPRLEDRRDPYPWLSTICVNLCISALRKEGVRRRLLPRAPRPEQGSVPAQKLVGAESSARLRTAVGKLSRQHQQAVYLRFACELSTREIAEVLGVDEAAARKRLSRAYGKLRHAIEGHSVEGREK